MGILDWLFGTKEKRDNSSEEEFDDPEEIIADANKDAMKMYEDFVKAREEGTSDELMQHYMKKHDLSKEEVYGDVENFELDEETSEMLDDLKFKEAERSRNQQSLNLTDKQRELMVEKKNDTQHQLGICNRAIKKGTIQPFAFQRAVILLSKEKRFEEALEICKYTEWWCADAKEGYDGWSYQNFNSPVLKKIVDRIPKLKAKLN